MLVLITPEQNIAREVEILHALFELGLERLQVRKPNFSKLEYKEYLKQIDAKWRSKIYLHQFHELVEEFELGGKHYRKTDLLSNETVILKGKNSTGAHSISEAIELLEKFDEVFVSPVFRSISKENYSSEEDFDITKLNSRTKSRLIALGGISEVTKLDARKLGFEHFAVLGSIWKADNPIESWNKLRKI